MDIGEAVTYLYGKNRLRRECWKDENPRDPSFIYLVPGSVFPVTRKPLLGIFEEGTEIRYRSHIDAIKFDENKKPVAWYYDFSQDDITAQDWCLYVSPDQLKLKLELESVSHT